MNSRGESGINIFIEELFQPSAVYDVSFCGFFRLEFTSAFRHTVYGGTRIQYLR